MTIKIEYPAKGKKPFRSVVITGVTKVRSAGMLKRRSHGIKIDSIMIDTLDSQPVLLKDIQHFEIVA